MSDRITAPKVRAMKARGEKIVTVTAYDSAFGAIADEAGVDVILVGDSVGNVMLGYDSTLPVTLEQMIHHTAATVKGVKRALVVADLPFGSYQVSPEQAVASSVALMKAGAQAVKLEGDYTDAVAAIVKAGIPVMGHLGMTPQSVHKFGGFRVQGKGNAGSEIVDQAKALEEAGAFSFVLELIPAELAAEITSKVGIPTIGIGAGPGCDGQVQVLHDVIGLSPEVFKHARAYINGRQLVIEALKSYSADVRSSEFPTLENSF